MKNSNDTKHPAMHVQGGHWAGLQCHILLSACSILKDSTVDFTQYEVMAPTTLVTSDTVKCRERTDMGTVAAMSKIYTACCRDLWLPGYTLQEACMFLCVIDAQGC